MFLGHLATAVKWVTKIISNILPIVIKDKVSPNLQKFSFSQTDLTHMEKEITTLDTKQLQI